MRFRRSWLLAFLLIAACGPKQPDVDASEPDGSVTGAEPRVEIGNGADTFVAFDDGDTLGLIHGCQGAQHVWIALRAFDLSPRGTILDLALTRDRDGLQVSQTFTVRVSLTPIDGTDYAEVTGLTLIVPDPDQAIGEDLTLRATVTAMDGASATSVRHIRVDWGEGGCL
jgi:hypothetical protein